MPRRALHAGSPRARAAPPASARPGQPAPEPRSAIARAACTDVEVERDKGVGDVAVHRSVGVAHRRRGRRDRSAWSSRSAASAATASAARPYRSASSPQARRIDAGRRRSRAPRRSATSRSRWVGSRRRVWPALDHVRVALTHPSQAGVGMLVEVRPHVAFEDRHEVVGQRRPARHPLEVVPVAVVVRPESRERGTRA